MRYMLYNIHLVYISALSYAQTSRGALSIPLGYFGLPIFRHQCQFYVPLLSFTPSHPYFRFSPRCPLSRVIAIFRFRQFISTYNIYMDELDIHSIV